MSETPNVNGDTWANQSDEQLVARVQGGDASAFDGLIERYKARLYSVIYNLLANHDDAADLSQETFLKAFKSIGSFKSKSNFYTWLYRIGVNSALNFIKKRKDGHFSLNELDPGLEEDPYIKELSSKENTEQVLDRQELQEKLNEALQKLSEEHRAVVVLHDIEGMKHQEIAKVLGCTEATARSRLFYAHQQLQALLANYL
jgi:RNA polymerase sigma factor (sigma-70 family)